MKKIFLFFILVSFFACSDGDFNVPAFVFEDTINSCDEYVLYVENEDSTEVLIITLSTSEIGTTVGDDTHLISSSIQIIYRSFDSAIGSSYFCQAIPPTSPKIINEIIAETGTINITTSEILENSIVTGYSYEISISDLTLNNGSNEFFYESFPYGTFELSI